MAIRASGLRLLRWRAAWRLLRAAWGGDGTGVEHDHVGVFGARNDAVAGGVEATCQRAIFAEVEPATQLVEKYAHNLELVAGCLRRPFVYCS